MNNCKLCGTKPETHEVVSVGIDKLYCTNKNCTLHLVLFTAKEWTAIMGGQVLMYKGKISAMSQAALDRGEDTTGLCTVRELVDHLVHHDLCWVEMQFQHKGFIYNVEAAITKIEPAAK